MSKFTAMNFNDGGTSDCEFVAKANLYTKAETIEECIAENDWRFEEKYCNGDLLRRPTEEDVFMRYVKYFPRLPDYCGYESTEGGYTYCNKEMRGCFPVWVIRFEDLRT